MTRRPLARGQPGDSAGAALEDSREISRATLTVEVGVHQGEEVGLGSGVCVIGRSSKCQLVLRRAEGVSRRHAEVEFTGSHYVVTDCGSRNGTLVNGLLVGPRFPLNDDDMLEVCDERIRFHGPSGRPEEAESAWLAAPKATTEPPPLSAPRRRGESPPPLPALKRAPPSPGRRSEPPPLPPSPQVSESAAPMPQERGPAPAVAVADPQAATAMLDTSSLVFPQSDPSIGPHADEEVFRDEEPAPPLPEAAPPAPKARERPPPPLPAPREHVGEEATRAPAPTMARGKGATLSLAGVALALATAAWCLWAWVGHGEAPKAEATAEGLLVAPVPTTRERDASAALPAAMPQPVPDEPSPAPEEPAPLQEPAATTAAAIRSDASGTVEVVLCEVGGEVTAGTPLLRVVDSAPRSQRKLAALRREERAFREAAESGDVRAKRELAAIRGELAGLEAARRVHVVTAPYAGRVVALQVAVGDAVTRGATVLTLEPAEESR